MLLISSCVGTGDNFTSVSGTELLAAKKPHSFLVPKPFAVGYSSNWVWSLGVKSNSHVRI